MIFPALRSAFLPPRSLTQLAAPGLAVGALALLMTACDDGGSTPAAPTPAPAPAPEPTPPPPPPEPETAVYTFGNPERRIGPSVPGTVPEGVAYATPLVIVAHAKDAAPFTLAATASDGLKLLAETSELAGFVAEAEAAGMELLFRSFPELLQALLAGQPVQLSSERPCFSYAQAITPSPDWFIGFSNLCLTDEEGRWVSDVEFEIVAYDAGTGGGEDFMTKSVDTEPREPISLLNAPPYFIPPAAVQVHSLTRVEE